MKRTETHKVIHFRVADLAKERNLSDLELAHLARVDARVIRRMWHNWRIADITISQMIRVARALDVPVCELMEEKERGR